MTPESGAPDRPLERLRIGFAGLGLMGRPMALRLFRAGAQLRIWNRTSAVADRFREPGMMPCADPAELASRADIVVLMLADTVVVEEVLFGPRGMAEALAPDSLMIDMGTTAVAATRDFARRLAARGTAYVDAPVSGGEIGAIEGALTIMAGGDADAVDRAMPLFRVLGRRITHVGATGAGQVAKAANQVIVGLNIAAVAEALALAERAGVDPAAVREALLGGFAASRVLEVHGQRMVDGTFEPGARVTTQHKDMVQACELAQQLGLELPLTGLGRARYRELIDRGDGDLDHSALIRLLRSDPAS
jgi:3-hydroxyisobutyrate dehydrogenase-like beta-hydroxyacid dehydrogenase